MKKHPTLGGNTYFNVFTVDSYQGEENDIILLSLVRSNDYLNIGFLDSKNRLVVALSRARRGLYIFGNAITLASGESTEDAIGRDPLWDPLLMYMRKNHQLDIDSGFPTACLNHGKIMNIKNADQFHALAGGCDQKCHGYLSCGHGCPYKCHPFDHADILCREACNSILHCGHGCSRYCGEQCECSECFVPESVHYNMPIVDHQEYVIGPGPVESGWGLVETHEDTSVPQSLEQSGSFYTSDIRNEEGETRARSFIPRKTSPLHSRHGFRAVNFNSSTPVFENPDAASPTSSPGSAEKWKSFNAEKSDKEMARKRLLAESSAPKVHPSQQVYHETYLPTFVQNGVRVKGKGSRRVVSRVDNDDDDVDPHKHGSVVKPDTLLDPFGPIGEAFSELKVDSTSVPLDTASTDALGDLIEL